jgi:hypothetical protein
MRKLKKKSHGVLGALQTQLEYAIVDRNAAQAETRATHAQRI